MYQGMTKKRMHSIEISAKKFLTHAGIIPKIDLLEGYEHYQEKNEGDDEVHYYVTIRMKQTLTSAFLEPLAEVLKSPRCIIWEVVCC